MGEIFMKITQNNSKNNINTAIIRDQIQKEFHSKLNQS